MGRSLNMPRRLLVFLSFACHVAACDGSGIVIGDAHIDRDGTLPDVDASDPCDSYTDADGDTISDYFETTGDFDGDTIPNFLDDDSDGDTIPDSIEAGDDDLCTPPVNSDWGYDSSGNPTGDELPDFLDSDSDEDGLTDSEEREWGTDRIDRDTDDDGYSDFVEVTLGSNPLNPTSTPDPDIIILELGWIPPEHEFRTLTAGTDHQVVDVYFLVDTNVSMNEAIEDLDVSLASTLVPAFRSLIPDLQMGVGHFNDVPEGTYGGTESQPFWNVQTITDDDASVQDALRYLHGPDFPFGGYSDDPESQAIALRCVATGEGFTECSSAVPPQSCLPDHSGYPCFRPGALPVVVLVSDAPWHNDHLRLNGYDCTSSGFIIAEARMQDIGARFVGVHVGSEGDEGYATMSEMALGTGSVDLEGTSLVEATAVPGVETTIVDLFATLAYATPMDVQVIAVDEPDDPPGADYDATAFLKDATPVTGFPDAPEGFASMDNTFFLDTVPGTVLTFELDFYNNTVLNEYDAYQIFRFWIVVLANGVEHLEARPVYVFVPKERRGWL